MNWRSRVVRALLTVVGCAVAADLGPAIGATAQQPVGQGSGRGAGGPAAVLFTLIDGNKDSAVTRDELKAVCDKWYGEWDAKKSNALTQEQVFMGVNAGFPAPAAAQTPPQNQTPRPDDVKAMMAALPDAAPVKPKQPRRVLVLARAAGFVHSSIPLAARTIEDIGKKTGAWSSAISRPMTGPVSPARSRITGQRLSDS